VGSKGLISLVTWHKKPGEGVKREKIGTRATGTHQPLRSAGTATNA